MTKPLKRAPSAGGGQGAEKRSLGQENRSLRAQLAAQKKRTLIGQSLPCGATMDIVMQPHRRRRGVAVSANRDRKELLARAIHDYSPRVRGPFVPSTARRCPRASSRRSCSAMKRELSRGPCSGTMACSCRPTGAPYS